MTLDRTPFTKSLSAANKEAQDFARKKWTTTVDIKVNRGNFNKLKADLNNLQRRKFKTTVTADTTQATAALTKFRKFQSSKAVNIPVDVSIAKARAKIAALRSAGKGGFSIAGNVSGGRAIEGATKDLRVMGNAARRTSKNIDLLKVALVSMAVVGAPVIGTLAGDLGGLVSMLGTAGVAAGAFALVAKDQLKSAGKEIADRFADVQKSLEAVTHVAIQPWIGAITEGMDKLPLLVKPASRVIFELGNSAKEALGSPVWTQYFRTIGNMGARSLKAIGLSAGYATKGFVNLLIAFRPVARDMEGGLLAMTKRFAAWSQTVGQSKGFQEFVQYVKTNGPLLLQTLGDFVQMLISVGKAISPISQALLKVISKVTSFISKLAEAHPVLIELVATMYLADKAVKIFGKTLIGRGVKGLLELRRAAKGAEATKWATTWVGRGKKVTKTLEGVGKAAFGVTGALGIVGGAGLIGAIGIAAAAYGGLIYATYKLGTASRANVDQIIKTHSNYKKASVALRKNYIQAQKDAAKASNQAAHAAGRSGDGAALAAALYGQSAIETRTASQQVISSVNHVATAMGSSKQAAYALAKRLKLDLTVGFKGDSDAAENNRRILQKHMAQVRLSNSSMVLYDVSMRQASDKTLTFTQRTQGLTSALKILNSQFLDVISAQASETLALSSLTKSVKQNGLSFNANTAAGARNVLALQSAATAAQKHYKTVHTQTHSLKAASLAFKKDKLAAYQNMLQLGLTKDEAQRLINKYYDVPGNVDTIVGTPGMKKAQNEIDTLKEKIKRLKDKNVSINYDGTFHIGSHVPGAPHNFRFAGGGKVKGGGTETSDSINASLSNNEHVWTAKEVAAAGGHTAVETMRRNVLRNKAAFAAGGPVVTRHINADTSTPGVPQIPPQVHDWAHSQLIKWAKKFASFMKHSLAASGASGAAQVYAASQLRRFGWGLGQMRPLIKLWNQESGWNPYAVNPTSGAYGIPQSLGHGHPYNLGDYRAQINWGLAYIARRYGSPGAAWGHEISHNWYDNGGTLSPGYTLAYNGTGHDETVVPSDKPFPTADEIAEALANVLARNRPVSFTLNGATRETVEDFADDVMFNLRTVGKGVYTA